MQSFQFRLWLCLLVSIVNGCASTPGSHDTFMGEGFRVSTIGPQTRAVVGGNHSVAVNKAVHWLNDHAFIVVNRWVAKDLEETQTQFDKYPKHKAYLLFMARKVEAPLAVLVNVEKKPSSQFRNSTNTSKHPVTTIHVEVDGVNAQTGDLMFSGKAWNSKALLESDQLIQDLTAFALQKGLNAYVDPTPPTPDTFQKRTDTQTSTTSQEPIQRNSHEMAPLDSPKEEATPSLAQQEDSVDLSNEEITTNNNASKSPTIESQISKSNHRGSPSSELNERPTQRDSSLGLKIASGALSILYTPFKASYALLGGFFGGLAYVVTGGDKDVANSVWEPSLGGTYWLTPQHLQGEEPINFLGPPNSLP